MVCPFDRAQALEQLLRDQEIAAQLACSRPSGPSRTHCLDCGNPIPELRRALGGILRDVSCQTAFEQGKR